MRLIPGSYEKISVMKNRIPVWLLFSLVWSAFWLISCLLSIITSPWAPVLSLLRDAGQGVGAGAGGAGAGGAGVAAGSYLPPEHPGYHNPQLNPPNPPPDPTPTPSTLEQLEQTFEQWQQTLINAVLTGGGESPR